MLTDLKTGVGVPCQSNDGLTTPQFTPIFPATCPYITSVGGTSGVVPESAWEFGSGGFSNIFARPAYQETAIQQYLNTSISPSTKAYYEAFTNFSGRGFPDLSAHSENPPYVIPSTDISDVTDM
jgi:tripeptidyl-peptidase-1